MRQPDYPFLTNPPRADAITIARHSRGLQSQAIAAAMRRAIGAVAARATQLAMIIMKRGDVRPGDEKHIAGRWIQPKAPLVLPLSTREIIRCEAGTVWITQGDSTDYILKAGESVALHPADEVVVTAMLKPALIRRMPEQAFKPAVEEAAHAMHDLTQRERELVALGAAMGSNCVPCIESHIPAARKTGLTDEQIAEAVHIADKVRNVPALKELRTALEMLRLPKQAGGNRAG